MATLPVLRLGTRKSALAIKQAELVRAEILHIKPEFKDRIELVPMSTMGDRLVDRPLSEEGGKGLFTKEIEEALVEGQVDIAVHSMKDMATVLPGRLTIAAMLKREDARDMLVGKSLKSISDIPQGAKFGTSSLRRSAQILMKRPDLKIMPFRGNVGTRLEKIEKGEVSATMLACAGLKRLNIKVSGIELSSDVFLPAVGQGAIGIECRRDDTAMLELLKLIDHADTHTAVIAERAFLKVLDGSCRTPIAGYAELKGNLLSLRGLIIKPDGSQHHSQMAEGKSSDAAALGSALGHSLLSKAGKDFLK